MNENLPKGIQEGLTIWVFGEEYYSIQEAAKILHVNARRIRECIAWSEDPMPFRCFPEQQRGAIIHRDDLCEWFNRNMVLLHDMKLSEYKRQASR